MSNLQPTTLHEGASTLLVGTSLGPESDATVRAALVLARGIGSQILVLHVLEPPPAAVGLLSRAFVRDGVAAAAREQLAAQLRRLGARTGEVADLLVDVGPIHTALLGSAERTHAELLMVGVRPPFPSAASVAAPLLRRARLPTWLASPRAAIPPRLVVAPVDLSSQAGEALRHGLDLLARCAGATRMEVVALYAVESDKSCATTDALPALEHFLTAHGSAFPGRLRGIVRSDAAALAIATAAREEGADLVLIGANALAATRPAERESLIRTLTRDESCALLVVPGRSRLPERGKPRIDGNQRGRS